MTYTEENYDPYLNICGNQGNFNVAVRRALKFNQKVEMKQNKKFMIASLVIGLILLLWAVNLVKKIPDSIMRREHMVFAILFSPVYILAYYLS